MGARSEASQSERSRSVSPVARSMRRVDSVESSARVPGAEEAEPLLLPARGWFSGRTASRLLLLLDAMMEAAVKQADPVPRVLRVLDAFPPHASADLVLAFQDKLVLQSCVDLREMVAALQPR
ncbi:MAG: hypothetical protein ACK40L_19505, partial [Hydrogenophaga sp.]